jgi:hypothetical protein
MHDVASAVDDSIGMEGGVEMVDVAHTQFTYAVKIALQFRHAYEPLAMQSVAAVVHGDPAIAHEGLQERMK